MNQLVQRVAQWAMDSKAGALSADQVPGATKEERSALGALGGLAFALSPGDVHRWPQQVAMWAEGGPTPPTDLTSSVASQLSSGVDVLATVYEALVAGRSRRRLGTFFTPPLVVEFLLDQAERLGGTPEVVIDPGAGVGAFTASARKRWPKARIAAVDVNVVTLGLLAARCAHQGLEDIDLHLEDYLEWIASRHRDTERTLIVGNPPYTRHQYMSPKMKQEAQALCGDLVESGLAGLSAYFLARSLLSLRQGDSLSLLLPGSWTEARYGGPLRAALWKMSARRVEFFAFPPKTEVFPGTQVSAVILLVGPHEDSSQQIVATRISLKPDSLEVGAARGRSRRGSVPDDFGAWLWPRTRPALEKSLPLGKIASVHRGVATGANSFFFLTDEERALLPEEATRKALLKIGQVATDVLDAKAHDKIGRAGERRWLLCLQDKRLASRAAVARLLKVGTEQGIHLRYLTSRRNIWYQVEQVKPPDLLFGPMSRNLFRTVINTARIIPSNSIYGIYLPKTHRKYTQVLAAWLNSTEGQRMLQSYARHYSGLMKLDPKRLEEVPIPDKVLPHSAL